MGAKIKLNSMNEIDLPTLVLATRSGKKLGAVPAQNIVFKDSLNSYSEISFSVDKFDNGTECHLWDEIADFKLLWCRDFDLWFEITVETKEENDLTKIVTGKTVCESELSQIYLYNTEINTEDDIAREEYKEPTVFFDEEHPENSLLNRLSEKIPHYTIKHVDSALKNIQRTFSFDNISIYDAFQKIAEEIECIFVFGSNSSENGMIARSISVYALHPVCERCGYNDNPDGAEFSENGGKCPKCGSSDILQGYGNDTGIFVSVENLADKINYSTNTDSVKNCFKLEAGDELMDATVRNCNPNGTNYIWYISDDFKKDMSDALSEKIDSYNSVYYEYMHTRLIDISPGASIEKYNSLAEKYNVFRPADNAFNGIPTAVCGFPAFMNVYYGTIDFKAFLQSELMPPFTTDETTAAEQVGLLTNANMSPVAITNITSYSPTVINNAVLGIARLLINKDYKVEIKNYTITPSSSSLIWNGKFIVQNINDENDKATGDTISITVNTDITTYLEQRIKKILKDKDSDRYSISNLFALEYSEFCSELKKYSMTCLKAFNDSCQAVLDVLIEQSSTNRDRYICAACGFTDITENTPDFECPKCHSKKLSNIYSDLYYPYYRKLEAIQDEAYCREEEIDCIDSVQRQLAKQRGYIQDLLNFKSYIGNTLWNEFSAYRRENTYSNSNYISDGLNNAELFKKAQEFIDAATKEIYKSAELQHSVSSTLKNLLAMDEFQSLAQNFEVGNWIRLKVDDAVYKLRLIEYEVDFNDMKSISVTFSDVLKVSDGYTDLESVIKQASSMATSYDFVAHQAGQGDKGNKRIKNWVEKGLSLTNSFISDSDNQEIVLDSHGLTMKEYLPITDTYSNKQLKIVNKGLYLTDDNWKTSRAGIGNFKYYDPRDKETKEAYGVIADTLIGNLILGENVGIYTSKNDISLNENGIMITNENNQSGSNYVPVKITINPNNAGGVFVIQRKSSESAAMNDLMRVDSNGRLIIGNDSFIVDESGDISCKNLNLGEGCSINWSKVSDNGALAKATSATTNIIKLASGTYAGGTFINGTTVSSPTIRGGNIVGGKFFVVNDPNAEISSESGKIAGVQQMIIDNNGLASYNSNGQLDGIYLSANDGFGSLKFYYQNEMRGELSQSGGSIILNGNQKLIIGRKAVPGSGKLNVTYGMGTWKFGESNSDSADVDFTYANVTGLKITFG